jgi:hypothetical protein
MMMHGLANPKKIVLENLIVAVLFNEPPPHLAYNTFSLMFNDAV